MNPIDRILAPLFPNVVVRRMAARQLIRAYEAAQPSRTHRKRQENRSANTAVEQAGRSLREQARFQDENNDIVAGLFDRLEERVVGRGVTVEPLPLNTDGTVNRELAAQIKQLWSEWSLHPETSGELTRPAVERLACRSWLRDGEVFAQHIYGTIPQYQFLTRVNYALEILEADYCPIDYNDTNERVRAGIARNAWKRPVTYWLHKTHPRDSLSLRENLKPVSAGDMIHLAHRTRIEQSRGVSILAPVLMRLADLKDYEESERVAARIAAALTMYIRKGDATLFTGDTDQATGAREIPIAPGIVFDGLAPGEDVGLIESNRPSALLEGFRNAMLRAVAGATRVSYSSLSRDYGGTYSSQRQELVESHGGYGLLQDAFIAGWSRPVYRQWLKVAVMSGTIKPPRTIDRNTLNNALYLAPVMPWIDPSKEIDAWTKAVRGGFADQAEVIRARGRDPAEVMRQRQLEIEEARDRGLVFDTDPAHEYQQTEEGEDGEEQ